MRINIDDKVMKTMIKKEIELTMLPIMTKINRYEEKILRFEARLKELKIIE